MKKVVAYCFIVIASAVAASYSPNPDAGMVSVSMDEESLQNLLSVLKLCRNIPLEIKKDFNLYEICVEEPTSIKHSIELRDFSMDITVKTKHGGIITIEKILDGKLEQ